MRKLIKYNPNIKRYRYDNLRGMINAEIQVSLNQYYFTFDYNPEENIKGLSEYAKERNIIFTVIGDI